ncbi:fungal protein [Schizosaccharomyces japonicus yFS275]|uniref:Fungal protein n=1 Tax=Schizosaccharomyces japonicus (strain yFS275 / FY16936) TaxID=402676 RepID=B6K5N1_SCHJY|nr:fungal protein [Schizosaccharomyces japonicus yFS275]EEB08835.1 fungal protein [Schizosaccharomyces japonicus yFS275]
MAYGVGANFPSQKGVTVSLKVNYIAPALADHLYKVVCTTTKVEGRKAWITGELYRVVDAQEEQGSKENVEVDGKERLGNLMLCARAEALFIEPASYKVRSSVSEDKLKKPVE